MADYLTLVENRATLSPWMITAVDALSWIMPTAAAIFSIGAGVCALLKLDGCAAVLGIAGGVISASGVIATGQASRIRDQRLEQAWSTGMLGIDMANRALSQKPRTF